MKVSANIKHNTTGSAPTVNDDSSKGYSSRSIWMDTSGNTGYLCESAAVGAAVWRDITTISITNLSEGATTDDTVDVNSSDGSNATLLEASTSRAGVLSKAKFDEIVANTSKVTNATHSGDASGATALTLQPAAITGKGAAAALTGTETVLLEQSGGLVKTTTQDIADLGGGDNMANTNLTLDANRSHDLDGNTLDFTNGQTTVRGSGATSGTNALLIESSTTEILEANNSGVVRIGNPTTAGIGDFKLHIKGDTTTTATWPLRVDDSADVPIFLVKGNGVANLTNNFKGSGNGAFTGKGGFGIPNTDGTLTDPYKLHVRGSTSDTSEWAILIQNSSLNNMFLVKNNSDVEIGFNGLTTVKSQFKTVGNLGFYNTTPIAQPTTGVAAATFAANTSGIADDTATFDGYTIGQVVKALRNLGVLA